MTRQKCTISMYPSNTILAEIQVGLLKLKMQTFELQIEEIKRIIFDQPPPFLYARHLYYLNLK